MLAAEPLSVAGLAPSERDRVVVTALADEQGREIVVSRFGDSVWDLSSQIRSPNISENKKRVRWDRLQIPEALLNDVKIALYSWFKRGRTNVKSATALTLAGAVAQGIGVLEYLRDRGIRNFDEVRPLHMTDYVNHLRSKGELAPRSLMHKFLIIDVCAHFSAELQHPFVVDPWGGQPLTMFCGHTRLENRVGKTPVIPPQIQAALFQHCEKVLSNSDTILDRHASGAHYSNGDLAHLEIRDAALYVLLITTGMRISEAAGVKSGSWRTEIRSGQNFHWVATTEFKTNKGRVDFLATPETIRALEVVERWAMPLQKDLAAERRAIEVALAGHYPEPCSTTLLNGMTKVMAIQRLATVKSIEGNLFLGRVSHKKLRVDVLSTTASSYRLKKLAEQAGVSWSISNHQCRRTFAWLVAQSRFGPRSLIFLKWQFKHNSMSMTELYASNPLQDSTLFDEVYLELVSAKSQLIEGWFEDTQYLSGGGGRKIMQMRSIRVESRKSLLVHTATHVNIRATGHGWCLAEQRGCVGEGPYEYSRCVNCNSGVIDESNHETWQGIHEQNLELLKINDCGPAVVQRAEREVARSGQVLQELGWER
ncbi:tyrosine-type recombinase/integrase [Acidovorax sp. Leaf84]|uniref:tyrosine-type recombinase/integrase n=1 Tax=Acidovorax sp. Leaf84 TaxID=1736240 RepID=UPI0009E6C4B1|nr:tyrosine-type recombinase/integrase [Acidovorax sp. Leaf84]